jgi:hypothetical protein
MPVDIAVYDVAGPNINKELVGTPTHIAEAVRRRTTELQQLAAANDNKAKETQKEQHDQRVKAPDAALDVGRLVMYAKPSSVNIPGTSAKLVRNWDGPYKIVEKPSETNRLIQDTRNKQSKFTVHVERLKPFVGELEPVPEGEFEVQEIMQQHTNKDGTWYRVRWAGYTRRSDTWETEDTLGRAAETLREFKKRPEAERLKGADKEGKTTMKNRPWEKRVATTSSPGHDLSVSARGRAEVGAGVVVSAHG